MAVPAFNTPEKKRNLVKLYKQDLTLEQISERTKISTPAIVRQLRKLKEAGVIKGRKIAKGGQTVRIQKEEAKLNTFLKNAIEKGEAQYTGMPDVAKDANVKLTKGQVGRFFDRYPSLYNKISWVTRALPDDLRKWLMETGPDGKLNYKAYYKGPLTNLDEIWTEVLKKQPASTSNALKKMAKAKRRKQIISRVPEGYINEAELAKKLGITPRGLQTLMTKKAQASKGEYLKKAVKKYLKPYTARGFKHTEIGRFYKDPDQKTIDILDDIRRGKGRLRPEVAKNVLKVFKDEEAFNSIKKGIPPELATMKRLGLTETEASTALMNISRKLSGADFFQNPELGIIESTPELKSQGAKLLKKIYNSPWGTQYYSGAGNKLALTEIAEAVGNKSGNIQDFKNAVVRVLRKNDIPLSSSTAEGITAGFNVNEPLGVKNIVKNKLYPFAHFVNLLEGKVNMTNVANLQGRMGSKFIPGIDAAIKQYRKTGDKKFLNEAYDLVDEFKNARRRTISGITKDPVLRQQLRTMAIPGLEITEGENLSEILQKKYGLRRIQELADKGYDIKGFAEKRGFLPTVAKGTPLFEELVVKESAGGKFRPTPFFAKGIDQLRSEFASNKGNICSILQTRVAEGGRIGMATGSGCVKEFDQALAQDADGLMKNIADQPAKGGAWSRIKTGASNILKKVPKGGRLGAILAGAGAVGLGAGALFGGSEAKAEEVIQEPGTTELEAMDFQIDHPASMMYNATEGNFVNAEGEKESQPGVLNWIAENPTKSSLMALPLAMGAGFGLENLSSKFGNESVARRGLGRAGRYLKGWKALIPAMMIPHALHEYKAGYDLPEMVTNPINALWALGIRGKKDLRLVEEYYKNLKAGQRGLDMTTLKGLKSVKGWKELPGNFKTAMMSPAAKGTNLAFGTTFRKPFVKTMQALDGIGATQGAKAWGKKALLRAALIPAGILAATPAGWLTAGFLGADFLWDQYKDYRDGNIRIDEMRARGSISEDEADNYRSLLLQGSIPFGIGNRMFGPDTMRIGGEDLDPTQQRELLKGMEAQLDEWQAGDMERRSKFREDHFEEGGRVGFKTGGMDRRTFLKWLAALAAGATGIFKGKSKDIVKPLVADATKAVPAKFIGVEGMPAWFPRAVAKIKAHGKLIQMADKHYVDGDIYEMVIPVTRKYLQRSKPGEGETYITKIDHEKVIMEDNPLTGEISMHWTGTDNFGDDAVRQINFKPGEAGYQKFGVDPEHPQAWEYQRVKVEEPEFTYSQPDQSNPYRDDIEYLDIFTEGDEIVGGLEKMTGTKQMVTKEGKVIDVSAEGKGVDEAFHKKIYKDIEGEGALQPDPEGHLGPEGEWLGDSPHDMIGGDVPEWVPKDKMWDPTKKAEGGIIETGNIARRPGAVPPLSGPTPQGEGIVGLFSNPKQVNMRS